MTIYPPTTNQLQSIPSSEVSDADKIRLWSQNYGGNVGLTIAQLKLALAGDLSAAMPQLTVQRATPTATGFSVTVNSGNTWLILLQDGSYAAGTIVLPSAPANLDVFECYSKQSVLSLTVDGNGNSVVGAPAVLAADDTFKLRYDAQSFTWYKVT